MKIYRVVLTLFEIGLVRPQVLEIHVLYRRDAVEGDFICCPVSKCCDNLSLTLGVGTRSGENRCVGRVIQEMYNTRDASSKNNGRGHIAMTSCKIYILLK